jgi:hypothetical protein
MIIITLLRFLFLPTITLLICAPDIDASQDVKAGIQGYYSFFEPRFKVDLGTRGAYEMVTSVARP